MNPTSERDAGEAVPPWVRGPDRIRRKPDTPFPCGRIERHGARAMLRRRRRCRLVLVGGPLAHDRQGFPSPLELKIRPRCASYAVASGPFADRHPGDLRAAGRASVTAITLPSHTENSRWCIRSMARPLGLEQPGSGHFAFILSARLSITIICPGSLSILT